ncbi:MAG: hypothetical protein PHR16_10545 [Methylovulum sp.]|nr:hypothetical protein [Methylovulum sp.]
MSTVARQVAAPQIQQPRAAVFVCLVPCGVKDPPDEQHFMIDDCMDAGGRATQEQLPEPFIQPRTDC